MSKRMLVLELACPHCRASLTDGMVVRLDGHVRETDADGEVLLSAVFGEYTVRSDLAITDGATVDFRCPTCEASLMLELACRQCGAKMVSLDLATGGYIEFCSRRGCRGHAIGGQGDPDEMMGLLNKMWKTPYD
jgi:hypothetical protein